jgi:hypothetical protein
MRGYRPVALAFCLAALFGTSPAFWRCSGDGPGEEPAISHLPVPQHPFLAPNGQSNMHNDAYMTDTYETDGPSGASPVVQLERYSDGVNTCVTVAFDAEGRILTTSAVLIRYSLLLLDPESLEVLATYPLPPRDISDPLFPYDDTSGATYFVVDDQDRILLADSENAVQIVRYSEDDGEFVQVASYDLSDAVATMDTPARDHVQMTIPDWDGERLWFTTRYGIVGTIDTGSGAVRTIDLEAEEIENSFAVGEDGVYIVSDHAMYRLNADGAGAPSIDWRTEYDRGTRVKPSNFNQGSGTTPQLFGDLVAIGDNAEPRMNVLFMRRSDGSLACSIPVFEDGRSTTENALPGLVREGPDGLEYSVIVDNNYGIDRANILGPGMCWTDHAGGLVRIDVVPDGAGTYRCTQVWHSTQRSSQVLPKLSLSNGLLYVYTYEQRTDGEYDFRLTAVDFETGLTAFSVPTGTGLDYANFGQPLALGPDGAAYLGTMGGLLRVADGAP